NENLLTPSSETNKAKQSGTDAANMTNPPHETHSLTQQTTSQEPVPNRIHIENSNPSANLNENKKRPAPSTPGTVSQEFQNNFPTTSTETKTLTKHQLEKTNSDKPEFK